MDIRLDKISKNDGLDGLEVLKEIASDEDIFGESPVPKEIDDFLYKGFLLISEAESKEDFENPCSRYWVVLNNKKIGYADIKHNLDEETSKIGGNIGLVLLKEYRNKGIGSIVLKELIDKAHNEIGLNEVLITTDENNISARRLIESLGGELSDIEEHCHYWFMNNKKIHK